LRASSSSEVSARFVCLTLTTLRVGERLVACLRCRIERRLVALEGPEALASVNALEGLADL
jgi:hypothetical protein